MRVIRWAFFLALISTGLLAWKSFAPVALSTPTVEFSIVRGSTLRSATRQMVDAGVGLAGWHFNLLARLTSSSTTIKAGSYAVSAGISPWEILRKITAGDFTQVELIVIEGWTVRQMRAALDANTAVRHDTAGLSDSDFMAKLGAAGKSAEGWFFPDTYLFGKGESDLVILARAHRAMEKPLEAVWS